MTKRLAFIYCALFLLFASPCGAASLSVTMSVAPLKYFAEQIGGDRVNVTVMVPAGASPATYEPKPRQMAALSDAKLFIAIGVPFERAWLPRMRSANPKMVVVKALAGIELMRMAAHHHDGSFAGEEHDGISDPHVWTSPAAAKSLSSTILSALIQVDPAGSSEYQKNYNRLVEGIDALDSDLRHLLEGKRGTKFLVYHPSWGYFARDYGLVQIPVELEGKEPGPRELAEVIRMAKKDGITVVFAQPQFSEKSARIVADAIDGELVMADPMSEDWANNLREVARSIKQALR